MLTIHLTMIYLHWLFKYRTDLKLCSGSGAVMWVGGDVCSAGMQFPEAMLKRADVLFTRRTH